MTPWQEWKQKNLEKQMAGETTVLSLLNPETPHATDEVISKRISICESCPSFLVTKQCKECGCFMPIKTKLLYAQCPRGLW